MPTVIVTFCNHFDLVWRRCWERDYIYEGKRYASYSWVEEQVLLRNLDLAERNEGAHAVEQALTLRMFLRKHPDARRRIRKVFRQGRFDVLGAGEAIADVNLCSFETMARNMASGKRYCRDVVGITPLLAYHADGFGSSAQFPQVIRQCGYRGISGLSYSVPDKPYWRGLDGSTVLCAGYPSGKGCWYDHCYHEPCRVCHGVKRSKCRACRGTGFDLPQNAYPPFEPIDAAAIKGDVGTYVVASEEMLPPENFGALLRAWEREQPGVRYRFGTTRELAFHWEPMARRVDNPPADQIASRVENNPVQTGCYVSRIRVKQAARRLEAVFYGWEKAICATALEGLDRARWEECFLELPLVFFHDAITGTHQDEACAELMDRMAACSEAVSRQGLRALRLAGGAVAAPSPQPAAGRDLSVFNPNGHAASVRVPLPVKDWRAAQSLCAVTADGRRWPVVWTLHPFSPGMPTAPGRLADATGPGARTRPDRSSAAIETDGLAPLAWNAVRLEAGRKPEPLSGRVIENEHIRLDLGDRGVSAITDRASGVAAKADEWSLGEMMLEEDEGDPWGTRKIPSFRCGMGAYTAFLGALRFDGYVEAYYAGRYEPNLRFAKEEDPRIFALDWYVTVRLLDGQRRVDFQYEVFWKAADRRLRAVFPVQGASDTGAYSIPGGWLKRDRYEQKETWLYAPNGDWPALYFHAVLPSPGKPGWALVNYGTPSARIENGRLLASLVRSPGFGHCLERYAQDYPMPTSGIRDGGWHCFSFSLLPFDGEKDLPAISLAATALNQAPPCVEWGKPAVPEAPGFRLDAEGVELVAMKPVFDRGAKRDVVVRLLNHRPVRARARLVFDAWRPSAVREVDMVEDPLRAVPLKKGTVELALGPFECKTLLLCGVG